MAASQQKTSVVIACVNGLPSISECLEALHRQEGGHESEIIVANCCRDGSADYIKTHYPDVVLLDFDERLGIPELRAIGVERATGDVICVIEDHCIVRPNWFDEIRKAHALGYDAVGGPVENACTDRLVDRAVYLTEYSDQMLPAMGGDVAGVAGNNAAYKRQAFQKVSPQTLRNDWEFFVQQEMRASGARFLSVPTMIVDHKKEFGFLYFVSQRFHYSRSFAGMRRRRVSGPMRLAYALASPLLVPMMLYRIGRQVVQKKRERASFVASLPLLFPFMVSYAAGECVGYMFGPGRSLLKVE
ncbi:MAG TPA: glycosyltransferase [Rhodothermales bacterium]|nr:glycosyltransferase [Rhodothermales bacterium]